MYDGEIPEFDPKVGMSENAELLYGVLELMPNRFAQKYRRFLVGNRSEFYIEDWNVEFALFLHFLREIGDRPGFGPVSKKKLLLDYCGEEVCEKDSKHKVARCVNAFLQSKYAHFKLITKGW